jgi:hypothetical protein
MSELIIGTEDNQGASIVWPVDQKNIFLRMAGDNFDKFSSGGGGTVNCQYFDEMDHNSRPVVGPNEKFFFHYLGMGSNGQYYYAIESEKFPNCFLRLSGAGVDESNPIGGQVNLQYYESGTLPKVSKSCWEVFEYKDQGSRTFALESYTFNNIYLSVDGLGMKNSLHNGGGLVSATWGIGKHGILQALAGY